MGDGIQGIFVIFNPPDVKVFWAASKVEGCERGTK